MPYEETGVTVGKSQEQIARLLKKYRVVAHHFTSFPAYATLEIVRQVDTEHVIPYRFTIKPKPGYGKTAADRAERQVWRVVYWWMKAKLKAIDFGLVEFEQEFLPYMMLSDGQGHTDTVDHIFFERLAGHTALPSDPFGGLRPALPEGRGEGG